MPILIHRKASPLRAARTLKSGSIEATVTFLRHMFRVHILMASTLIPILAHLRKGLYHRSTDFVIYGSIYHSEA